MGHRYQFDRQPGADDYSGATVKTEWIEVSLTQGQKAIIDVEDAQEILKHKWYARHSYAGKTFYAYRNTYINGKRTLIAMHQQLLAGEQLIPNVREIDHINQNGLDNRKTNLRVCTRRQNKHNVLLHRDNTSGYKGVWKIEQKKQTKWGAAIKLNGKTFHLGHYLSKEEAARAYDNAAITYYGEFALTNAAMKLI